MVENLWAIGSPPRTLLGELTALPGPPSWWAGGCCPLPRNHTPALGLRPSVVPAMKTPGQAPVVRWRNCGLGRRARTGLCRVRTPPAPRRRRPRSVGAVQLSKTVRSSRCSLRHSAGGPPSRRPNPVLLGRPALSPRAISPRPRARRRRRVSTEWEWGQLRVTSAPNLVDEAHQRVTDVIYWSQQQPTPATAAAAAAASAGNRDAQV